MYVLLLLRYQMSLFNWVHLGLIFFFFFFFFVGRGAKPLGLDLSKVHGAYLHDSILAKEMNSNQLKASLGWVIINTLGSRFGRGIFHYRRERTQTQQAQYNEFAREASWKTRPLRGLHQRSGRIIGEEDRRRRSWGRVKVRPRASSEDEFFFSYSDTTPLELSLLPPPEISLVIYSFAPFILAICRLCKSPLECLSHPMLPSTCCELQ